METIIMLRLLWAEIIINAALIIANGAMHIHARCILKSADALWLQAMDTKGQAQRELDQVRARASSR